MKTPLRIPRALAAVAAALLIVAACYDDHAGPVAPAVEGPGAPRFAVVGYEIVDLTDTSHFEWPTGINRAGHVVGSGHIEGGAVVPYLWTPSDGIRRLEPLGVAGAPEAINDMDQVLWRESSVRPCRVTRLGSGVAVTVEGMTECNDINNRGEVAGTVFREGRFTPAVWTPGASGMSGTIRTLDMTGNAWHINNAGVIAVVGNVADSSRAMLWKRDDTVDTLPSLGGRSTSPSGINDAGWVVGTSQLPSGEDHIVLWSPDGNIQDLGVAGERSYGRDVNDVGQVLGVSVALHMDFVGSGWGGREYLQPIPEFASGAMMVGERGQIVGYRDLKQDWSRRVVMWTINHPPSARLGGPFVAAVGAPIPFDASGSSDPDGDALSFQWYFDADGSVDATGPTAMHAYPAPGGYRVRLRVSDDRGGTDTASAVVTVQEVVPGISIHGPYVGREGSRIAFSSAGSETADGGGAKWYRWDFGDGTRASSRFQTTPFGWSKRYEDDGTYQVTLTVVDVGGTVRVARTTAVVANSAPRGVLGGATFITEGSAPYFYFHFVTDSSSADRHAGYAFAFDCGWGSYGPWQASPAAACPPVFNENAGRMNLRARVRDKDGGVREYLREVSVFNVAATVTIGSASLTGNQATVVFSFSDPGINDRWQWRVVWGDDQVSEGVTVRQDQAVTVGHTYAAPRTGPTYVTVSDGGKFGRSPDITF
jgi:probable HAF family extracellular repeat protein